MNRQVIQTQAPIGQVNSAIPSGFKVQMSAPKPVPPSPANSNVAVGSTAYGTGFRLAPVGMRLGTLISQGKIGGNSIAGAKSSAIANVTAQETKFHAFVDALKQNALLFLRHFDMSLQRRLGISMSSLRPNYQNVSLIRPTQTGKKM
jgi:hypothetical protein